MSTLGVSERVYRSQRLSQRRAWPAHPSAWEEESGRDSKELQERKPSWLGWFSPPRDNAPWERRWPASRSTWWLCRRCSRRWGRQRSLLQEGGAGVGHAAPAAKLRPGWAQNPTGRCTAVLFHPPALERGVPKVKYNNIRVKSFDLSTPLSPCGWFHYTCSAPLHACKMYYLSKKKESLSKRDPRKGVAMVAWLVK